MQTGYIARAIEREVISTLRQAPAVAILGPRQCGKSTLAREIIGRRRDALYLDLDFRAASGAELDLVIEKGRSRIAVECKASAAPSVGAGFWNALADLSIQEAWIIAPVKQSYPLRKGVTVAPLEHFLQARGRSGKVSRARAGSA